MSRRKAEEQPPEEAEVVADTVADATEQETPLSNQELAEFVQNLVKHFVSQEIQGLEQRIVDLELLVGQPQDAVQFTQPPEQPHLWSNTQPEVPDTAPWYQPNR